MKIERQFKGDLLVLQLTGQLDATWSSAVDGEIGGAVREGRHHIVLDLAGVDYISSAGLRVLLSHYKGLKTAGGSFSIRSPQPSVMKVIELSGLDALLSAAASTSPAASADVVSKFETTNAKWERHGTLSPARVKTLGGASPFDRAAGEAVAFSPTRFGFGIGAIAGSANEAAARLGETVGAAGCVAHLPAGDSNRADFMVSESALVPTVWMSSGITFEGTPDLLLRFESELRVGLGEIARAAMDAAGGAAGFVLLAETAGLVGASIRQSPAVATGDPFAFPGIRDWLNFTSERAYRDTVSLVVGVAAPPGSPWEAYLRAYGAATDLHLHAHAAVFPYRPVRKGAIALGDFVAGLFDAGGLQSVLHLLHDAREPDGVGESEFFRGACWVANLT